jgi:hypothetical protein
MSAGVGLAVPAASLIFMQLAQGHLVVEATAERVILCLWPSAIFLLASQSPTPLAGVLSLDPLLLMSVAANVVLYAGLGTVLWAGLTRSRVLIVPLAVVLAVMWWRMWTL